jgi:hypothetical protein
VRISFLQIRLRFTTSAIKEGHGLRVHVVTTRCPIHTLIAHLADGHDRRRRHHDHQFRCRRRRLAYTVRMPKISALAFHTQHAFEHYGNLVTYYWLNNIVPDSELTSPAADKPVPGTDTMFGTVDFIGHPGRHLDRNSAVKVGETAKRRRIERGFSMGLWAEIRKPAGIPEGTGRP